MTILADTNIGLRWIQKGTSDASITSRAIRRLRDQGARLVTAPQNFAEFWAVSTRPSAQNGLGLSSADAVRTQTRLESVFALLPDDPASHAIWRGLVVSLGVRGKQVHDARIAAAMIAHGVTSILTFNGGDFARYPGLTVLDPRGIAAGP